LNNKAHLDKLAKDIDKARMRSGSRKTPKNSAGAMAGAFRLATELVVGIFVGGFIGWWLDELFATKPVMLLLFLVFGFVAGIMNTVRTAKDMQRRAIAEHGIGKDMPDDDGYDAE
jgi:ATP synthase protein I